MYKPGLHVVRAHVYFSLCVYSDALWKSNGKLGYMWSWHKIIGWSLAALKSRSIRKLMPLKALNNLYYLSKISSFSIILHHFGPQCLCLLSTFIKSLLSCSYCLIYGKFIHFYRNLVRVSAFVTFKLILKNPPNGGLPRCFRILQPTLYPSLGPLLQRCNS